MTPAPRLPDVVVLGAGAAGLYCAGIAARRGLSVLLIEHAANPGEKIRISGGGRCNFTNIGCGPQAFLSENRHFAKSALARHGPQDFLALMARHGIAWHEKTLGQLFCDGKATQIVAMLRAELSGAELLLATSVEEVVGVDGRFRLRLSDGGTVETGNLVVATGGKSIPKMGATDFGHRLARQFGLEVTELRPALVPLTFGPQDLEWIAPLSGLSLPVTASAGKGRFDEALLFTHRGLSGPAILQISSYWREGQPVTLRLLPGALEILRQAKRQHGRRGLAHCLAGPLPARLAEALAPRLSPHRGPIAELADTALQEIASALEAFEVKPSGTEGYRTAEVTLGGVSTGALDARSLQARVVPGLHFVGEVVDVTGWLGGYNFQWAWSSAHACASALEPR